MLFSQEVPVRYETDVFVAGGGPAGCAAAVFAARAGVSVFLAEANGCFGGLGTVGLVPGFCQYSDGENFLAGGFGREIFDRHYAQTGIEPNRKKGFPIRVEVLKRIYDDLLTEAGVQYSLLSSIIGIDSQDGHVSAAVLSGKSGLYAVKAKIFIDCTGDGDLSVWAGAPYMRGGPKPKRDLMPGTLCSLWAGVDWSRYHGHRETLQKAIDDGVFSVPDLHLPGMWNINKELGIAGGNVGHAYDVDGTDEESMTKALVEQRKRLLEYKRFYNEYVPGFEKADLMWSADMMGIRETRRIECDYNITLQDYIERAKFPDEIGRYAYPVDIHPASPDPEAYARFLAEFERDLRYKDGESYGIPYRCLLPKYTDNLLVAGRCVGTEREVQASIRVMPGCYITGQTAGTAAALATKSNTVPRGIDVSELQQALIRQGGYLPNYKA